MRFIINLYLGFSQISQYERKTHELPNKNNHVQAWHAGSSYTHTRKLNRTAKAVAYFQALILIWFYCVRVDFFINTTSFVETIK